MSYQNLTESHVEKHHFKKIPEEGWNRFKPKKRYGSYYYDNHDILKFGIGL